ncbi:MAG: hypothetical protein JW810_11435 [Sedimentisphaerales bacterium]|nr:hypothetical protein [Sedimentisphaerales bacterium]
MDGLTKTQTMPAPCSGQLGRLFCFFVLSSVGMGAIGLALLARPAARYLAERRSLTLQQQWLDDLRILHAQQQELLGNLDNPSVLERAAVNNLKYEPAEMSGRPRETLPPAWPELEKALTEAGRRPEPPAKPGWQTFIETLAVRGETQLILAILGAALVVVSLSCFYRSR